VLLEKKYIIKEDLRRYDNSGTQWSYIEELKRVMNNYDIHLDEKIISLCVKKFGNGKKKSF
jgi:hypothetical protein